MRQAAAHTADAGLGNFAGLHGVLCPGGRAFCQSSKKAAL